MQVNRQALTHFGELWAEAWRWGLLPHASSAGLCHWAPEGFWQQKRFLLQREELGKHSPEAMMPFLLYSGKQ